MVSDAQKHSLATARGESEGYIAEKWRGSIASCQIQNPVQLMLILYGPAATCQSRQPTVICLLSASRVRPWKETLNYFDRSFCLYKFKSLNT